MPRKFTASTSSAGRVPGHPATWATASSPSGSAAAAASMLAGSRRSQWIEAAAGLPVGDVVQRVDVVPTVDPALEQVGSDPGRRPDHGDPPTLPHRFLLSMRPDTAGEP